MHIIKGFTTINQYINNTPGETALLGELSPWSFTYSKEKGEYQAPEVPGYKLITFKSVDNDTLVEQAVSTTQVVQILQVIKECVAYAGTHIRPYDTEEFRNNLLTEFHERIYSIEFGSFVDNGALALPEWISWKSSEHNDAYIRIWLADQSFAEQYDDYEIEVIAPMLNIDDMFGFYSTAVNTMNDRTISQLSDAIMAARDGLPETYLRMFTFDFLNIANTAVATSTNWAVLIYGRAGDNIDTIKDAIIEHILANSTHTRSEWAVKFPEIFRRTEFIILPRWDKLSVPNLTVMSALYSSIMNISECLQFARDNIPFYPVAFIDNNTSIMPYDYKAISLLVVNGYDNPDGKRKITDLFPDYIPIPTSSIDFNRMQVRTRDWLILLETVLMIAETANEFTSVPTNLRRIKRGDTLYISALYNNINYLVAAKSNTFYSD